MFVGVSLGNSFFHLAYECGRKVEVMKGLSGLSTMVSFTNEKIIIGDATNLLTNPSNTIFDLGKIIGRKYSDPIIQENLERWPFQVIQSGEDDVLFEVQFAGERKTYSPEEVLSKIFLFILKCILKGSSYKLRDIFAMVSVPSHFTDAQREVIINAARAINLDVSRITNKATSILHSLDMNLYAGEAVHFLTLFLGGSSLDISVTTVVQYTFQLRATCGDSFGGNDLTEGLLHHVVREFHGRNAGVDIQNDTQALHTLRNVCESAKKILSQDTVAIIEVPELQHGVDFYAEITREQFEDVNTDYFNKIKNHLVNALQLAGLEKNEIHHLVLAGGSSHIPKVRRSVSEFFEGKDPIKTREEPENLVAFGACYQTGSIEIKRG